MSNVTPLIAKEDKKLRKFTFMAEMDNGIRCIYGVDGEDVSDATKKAVDISVEKNWEYLGRVTTKRSAYDRAAKEN